MIENTSIRKFTGEGTGEAQPLQLESSQVKHLCNSDGLKDGALP